MSVQVESGYQLRPWEELVLLSDGEAVVVQWQVRAVWSATCKLREALRGELTVEDERELLQAALFAHTRDEEEAAQCWQEDAEVLNRRKVA